MIANLPERTGRPLDEWFAVLDDAGLEKHAQAMALLKSEYGVTHGFANLIVTLHRSRGIATSDESLVDAQYSGKKGALRPIYERLVELVTTFGDDVQVDPKKTGVSLRRSKQFALIEAPSAARVQLGVNLRDVAPEGRLRAATGMCTHRIDVTAVDEVDDELVSWLREAYRRA